MVFVTKKGPSSQIKDLVHKFILKKRSREERIVMLLNITFFLKLFTVREYQAALDMKALTMSDPVSAVN